MLQLFYNTEVPTNKFRNLLFLIVFLLYSCSDPAGSASSYPSRDLPAPEVIDSNSLDKPLSNPDRNAYFGDLHVHTENSFDAYTFGTLSDPAAAYRYARGYAIPHPTGYQIQLSRSLDFYAVTDHALFLGLVREAGNTSSAFAQYDLTEPLHNLNESVDGGILDILDRQNLYRPFARAIIEGLEDGVIDQSIVDDVEKTTWQKTIKAADDAYIPGVFTTFAGFEYTSGSGEDVNSTHRNVIFRDTNNLPAFLFSRIDSTDPERLWDWMNNLRSEGVESLAIPHNSNLSGGLMFKLADFNDVPFDDDYSNKRYLNEPLVEVTQTKGTSETHPLLSTNDEWANFEVEPWKKGDKYYSQPSGSYVRDAYLKGLTLSEKGQTNPYKFGLIGSSDAHVGGGSENEEVYFSKVGILDGTPELRGSIPFNWFYGVVAKVFSDSILAEIDGKDYIAGSPRIVHWSASGLAGVWAEENTRESIYDALRRRETFATSGPRIKLRFFAGYGLDTLDMKNSELIKNLYNKGTSMGGTVKLQAQEEPTFFVWAVADALGAPLQRVQIIKGWLENGEAKEKVYDVACSDGLSVNPDTHRCPDNGAKVSLNDCSISGDSGAMELKTFWQDPEFSPDQEAFYYSRVIENPICRWSTWDAIRAGVEPRSDLSTFIQERAWSSPIWFE